jgi:hypothetical protein
MEPGTALVLTILALLVIIRVYRETKSEEEIQEELNRYVIDKLRWHKDKEQ